MSEISLALRNLLRQPVRSSIALSAIIFAVIALILSGGFIEWIFWAMREATVHSRIGHIQLTRPGFFTHGQNDLTSFLLPERSSVVDSIGSTTGVQLVTPRLSFSGLISHGDTTLAFIGEGVDPQKEKKVSTYLFVVTGDELSLAEPRGIILGEGLAANLGVKVGDRVTLLAQPASGGINGVEAHVRGIFYTLSKQFDDAALRIPITVASELLRVSGVHAWVVLLDETDDTQRVLTQLRKRFSRESNLIQFTPWNELADFYNKTVALYSRQMDVLNLIIGLIIVLSIANTMTRTVLERTGEIGTLLALGNRRKKILRLFVVEGLIIGLLGGLIGLFFGEILAAVISGIGIPMPPAPGMSRGFSGEIRVTLGLITRALLIAVFTAVIASLYPAWKASRLNIVDALRHNR